MPAAYGACTARGGDGWSYAFVGNDTSSPGADGAWDISSVADANLEPDLARADVAQTLDAAKEATGEDVAGSEGHPGVDAVTVVDAGSDIGILPVK